MKEVATVAVVELRFKNKNLDSNLGFNTIEPRVPHLGSNLGSNLGFPRVQTWAPTQVTTLIEPGFNPDSNPVSNLRSNLGSIPRLKPEFWAK